MVALAVVRAGFSFQALRVMPVLKAAVVQGLQGLGQALDQALSLPPGYRL